MHRRRMVVIAATVVLVAGGGGAVWKALRSLPYVEPQHQTILPVSAAREMAYVDRHWQHGDTAGFGSFGGTDCVNFTSQALLARGWPMTAEWGHSQRFGLNQYTRTWVSSTALDHYLAAHPGLAVAVEDTQRDRLRVGDIAQFDWDDSGDRDHTGIVSGVTTDADGRIAVTIAEHSPAALHQSVDALLAAHAATRVQVHYWHLLR